MSPALAARILTDAAALHPQIEKVLAHATSEEVLGVLDRIEEYRLALRPRNGEPPLLRAVQVALDSIAPFVEEVRQ